MTRIFKLGIISAVVFFIILYLMSLLIPSHVRISRAINIDAPLDTIRPYISEIRRWPEWNTMANDKIQVKKVSEQPEVITTRWEYGGRKVTSSFRLEESAGITVVQWYFDFHMKWYPWEKFGSITFDKQFGTPMESSLNNLKKLMENSP
jgi:hypothetical protein